MRKQFLIWIAPTVAVALAFAYFATAPQSPDAAGSRPALTRAETAKQTGSDILRSPGEASVTPRFKSAPVSGTAAGNCTMVTRYLQNDDGTATEVYTCVPLADGVRHPYESYSNDALASLAYSDAKAAEILGMRLRDDDEEAAMSLIFRASALAGGDFEPILAFSNAYPHPSSVDGVPVRETVHRKFVMSAVAELLGAERNNLGYWEGRIRQASTDPEREINLLRAQARKIVDEMRQIQLDVTGSSSIGGADDA